MSCTSLRLCCTIQVKDSLRESSVIGWRLEQLGTPEIQERELVILSAVTDFGEGGFLN